MSSRRITFRPIPDRSSEETREMRARAWAFIFDCWRAKQEGRFATDPDNVKVERHGRRSA